MKEHLDAKKMATDLQEKISKKRNDDITAEIDRIHNKINEVYNTSLEEFKQFKPIVTEIKFEENVSTLQQEGFDVTVKYACQYSIDLPSAE